MIRDILNEIDAVEQALARDDGPQRAYLTRRRADLLAGCRKPVGCGIIGSAV